MVTGIREIAGDDETRGVVRLMTMVRVEPMARPACRIKVMASGTPEIAIVAS